jgi:hypothetical protein
MEDQVGGTKIQRRQPPPLQQQPQQQMGQINPQQMTPEQQAAYQQMAYKQQQQQLAYQQQQQQQINRQSIPPQVVGGELDEPMNKVNRPIEVKSKPPTGSKSKFGNSSEDNSNFKETLIVVLLFVVLNSKLVWKQLMKLPFMGSVEPSIIALIVNSLLAGIVYFIIKKFLLPK